MKKTILSAVLCIVGLMYGRTQEKDTLSFNSEGIEVQTTRVQSGSPVAHVTINARSIDKLNSGQDLPYILRYTPGLVATSDGGTGVGYTGLWIRGSDPSRINVTLNGVPLNDAESQQVFWVNLPDFASGTHSIQIQRGAGVSTNGPGSFGGSIHLDSFRGPSDKKIQFNVNYTRGSYGLQKSNYQLHLPLNKHWRYSLRYSQIASDGYVNRASAKLEGYQQTLEGNYGKWKWLVTAFGGKEQTYQAWYGAPYERVMGNDTQALLDFASRNGYSQEDTDALLNSDRRYNYYRYPNQVDQYQQHHQQLHVITKMGQNGVLKCSLFHTRGAGYFEEFKSSVALASYGIPDQFFPGDSAVSSDANVVRRRWLDNHLYGGQLHWTQSYGISKMEVGAMTSVYQGRHSGEVIAMQPSPEHNFLPLPYYRGQSTKWDNNIMMRYVLSEENWSGFVDCQVRQVHYQTNGMDNDLITYDKGDNLVFFNPKMGVSYMDGKHRVNFYLGHVSKEPNRNDYVDHAEKPKPEHMLDTELSWNYTVGKLNMKTNVYWMQYQDQLVLTGALNDVGAPLRANVKSSFRRGIEWELEKNWTEKKGRISLNTTLSQNKIRTYDEIIYAYTDSTMSELHETHNNTDIGFSPRVISALVLEKGLGKNWSIMVGEKYVSKQFLDNTQNNDRSIVAYAITDIKISHTFRRDGFEIQTGIWVNNAWNAMYSSNGYTYSYYYGSLVTERFYYPQAGRNFMVTCAIKFTAD